jgi:hypothetical protein
VAATTIETIAIANVERIGRSISLRRHAAAALNHHSIAGGLTGNFDNTNSAGRLNELDLPALYKPRSPLRDPSIRLSSQNEGRDATRRQLNA